MKYLCFILMISPCLAAGSSVTMGTFNAEFLNENKIHIKYGYRFELEEPADIEAWSKPGFRHAKLMEATDAVAKALVPLDVDIWCFTEVGTAEEVKLLQDAFAKHGRTFAYMSAAKSADTHTGQNVAVLSRFPLDVISERIDGVAFYDAEMDEPYTEDEATVDKGLHVVVRLGSHKVHLFVTHLTSELGGHEKDEKRVAQATIIRRSYLPYLMNGEHVIVAGDLNDHIGQPAIRRIRGRDDLFEALIQTADRKYVLPQHWSDRWTYNFRGEYNLIDHILVSRSLIRPPQDNNESIHTHVEPLWDTQHFKKRDLFTVSDHRPLIVTLDLSFNLK